MTKKAPDRTMSKDQRQRIAYRVAQLFIEERATSTNKAMKAERSLAAFVADRIRAEFDNIPFSREKVYSSAALAVRLGYFALVPPFEVKLQERLTERYPHLADHIHVVHTANHLDSKKVSVAAAQIALKRARKLVSKLGGKPLALGLGPGRATRDFCESFGDSYPKDGTLPKLDLFAITAGCPARESEYASTSFFNLFDDRIVNERVGIFAESLVPKGNLNKVLGSPGVREAYNERNRIHMVVTSMGDMNDKDDLLRTFLEQSKVKVSDLLKQGWVGNVQYRPYTANGPVKEQAEDLRAVTLFELKDLVKRANRDDRSVILIARQCGKCKRTRAKALEPLLKENSNLRVFSDLIMDAATCEELLQSEYAS